MPGIQRLQEIPGLCAAYFAYQNSVRPVPESRFHEIAYRDGFDVLQLPPGLKTG
jgi:hypothetical protein